MLSLIFMLCLCFSLAGCNKDKKYDVTIKVVNDFGGEWFFTPDVDEIRVEYNYIGEKMHFWIDSWNLSKHPRWHNDWFPPNTSGPDVFGASYGKIGQMYYEEDPKYICERGEYYYHVYADSTSDLWNFRSIYLYITVI